MKNFASYVGKLHIHSLFYDYYNDYITKFLKVENFWYKNQIIVVSERYFLRSLFFNAMNFEQNL